MGATAFPGYGLNLAVFGHYAVVAVGDFSPPYQDQGLRVFDLSAREDPVCVAFLHTSGNGRAVAVSDTHAYLVAAPDFYVIDLSDPTSPAIVGSTTVEENTYAVTVSGTRAYVAGEYFRLRVIDVSDPSSPRALGVLTGSQSYGVVISEDHAFVACGNGLQVIDVANPTNPPIVGHCEIPGLAKSIAAAPGYAYVSNGTSFYVIDTDASAGVSIVGSVDPPGGHVTGIDVLGNYAYVAQGEGYPSAGVRMIDVSDPENPWIASWMYIEGGANEVAASGNYAYVTAGDPGLRIVDFTDLNNPQIVGGVDTPGSAVDIALSGEFAFVATADDYPATESGLWVVDVPDPTDPVFLGGLYTGKDTYLRSVAVAGDFAYITGNVGFRVIDISDPEALRIVAHVPTSGGEDVKVDGTIAYVAEYAGGVRVVDVAVPDDPRLVGDAPLPGYTNRLALSGSLVLVATHMGLQILEAQCDPLSDVIDGEGAPLGLRVRTVPNPTAGPTSIHLEVARPGPVELSVFDPVGRRIRRLIDRRQIAGSHEIVWDGRNEEGRPVGAGIYFVRIWSPDGTATRQIALIR